MATETTLIVVKPDGVERGLVGEIVSRFETRGFQLRALKMMTVSRELAEKHYEEHAQKPFFGELVEFITGGPVVAMLLEAPDAVKLSRTMIGATKPVDAAPGTIRAQYTCDMQRNLIHGSDSPESATRERALWFPEIG
jgi:nucleoside-diphosphate kinase